MSGGRMISRMMCASMFCVDRMACAIGLRLGRWGGGAVGRWGGGAVVLRRGYGVSAR